MPQGRGRPPKPVEQKERLGNPGKRALPKAEVELAGVASGVPPMPQGLQATGKRMWSDTWEAARLWLNPQLDGPTIGMACRLADQIAGLHRDVEKHGRIVKEPIVTPTGEIVGEKLVANPALKELRAAEKSLMGVLSDLAIPPVARARLGLAKVKVESKFEQLLRARSERSRSREVGGDVVDAEVVG